MDLANEQQNIGFGVLTIILAVMTVISDIVFVRDSYGDIGDLEPSDLSNAGFKTKDE